MSTTYTTNAKLQKPGTGDRNWDVPVNANTNSLDAMTALGGLCVTMHEIPSASLTVDIAAGVYTKQDGTFGTYAGTTAFAVTGSTTTCLWLTDAGVLTTGGSFPTTASVRLATVVAGTSTITSVTDGRVQCSTTGTGAGFILKAGDTLPASNFVLDTTTGTKIGTATTQKLGFLGATPVVQQANTVDLGTVVSNFGLRASGGNFPLNMGSGALTCGAANLGGTVTITDAVNIAVGSTTGTQIGTATTQKLGFYAATPVVRPSGASEAALGTLVTVTVTDSTTGTATTTLNDVGSSFSQSAINNNFASVAAQLNHAVTDFASVKALLNQLRSDLVALGLIKGSA